MMLAARVDVSVWRAVPRLVSAADVHAVRGLGEAARSGAIGPDRLGYLLGPLSGGA